MKSILLFFSLLILGVSVCSAQEIGARWGQVSGGDFAVDMVFGTSEFNRMHADLSFGDGFGVDLLWDILYRPLGDLPLHYYGGLGVFAFFDDPFVFGALGELGLEYRFKDVPLVVGGDWRPFFRITQDADFGADGFGFNVRYVFN